MINLIDYGGFPVEDMDYVVKLLTIMEKKQDSLNKELTGNDSYATELVTKDDKSINYGECLVSETAELLESTDWKHWKHMEMDRDNINTEIIDILHFALSTFLTTGMSIEDNYASGLEIPNDDMEVNIKDAMSLEISVLAINSALIDSKYGISRVYGSELEIPHILDRASDILDSVLFLYMVNNSIVDIREAGDRIFKDYMVKNVLNSFRTNNGYKDGTYIKDWNGEEDNTIAYRIADEYVGDSDELESYLLEELAKTYSKIA